MSLPHKITDRATPARTISAGSITFGSSDQRDGVDDAAPANDATIGLVEAAGLENATTADDGKPAVAKTMGEILIARQTQKIRDELFGPEPIPPEDAAATKAAQTAPEPVRPGNPLVAYSLLGSADEFEAAAEDAKPLLGDFCFAGQATVLYAPPNAGKTLIILKSTLEAVEEGRIAPGNVYYVNADDNSSGLADKLRLMQDIGVHTLVPGFKGFSAAQLVGLLSARRRTARPAARLSS